MRHILAAGQRLECAWHGPGPDVAPTLVFLHEGLGSVSTWRDFPAELAEATGYGALVYSRAGHAGSDPVPLPRPLRFMHDRVPVLLIQGEQDEYGTLRQLDAIEAGCSGPVRRVVLERCGHSPHRDQPHRTLAAMTAFVREMPGGCLS